MSTTDWNPDLYLKFDRERIQPSIDLISRIDMKLPRKIIDIGCGPGNSTQILFEKWPESVITGADNSPAMIQKAKKEFPQQNWILFDAAKDMMQDKFDIVFSNAAFQWIPDHKNLIRKFFNILNKGGTLAVQLPLFFHMPVGKVISDAAENQQWNASVEMVKDMFTIESPSFYYDSLAALFSEVEIWVTHYMHIMNSHLMIFEMIRSTGLRPYIDRIRNEEHRCEFEGLVLKGIENAYPPQKNGRVIFPFIRLFFVAKK